MPYHSGPAVPCMWEPKKDCSGLRASHGTQRSKGRRDRDDRGRDRDRDRELPAEAVDGEVLETVGEEYGEAVEELVAAETGNGAEDTAEDEE